MTPKKTCACALNPVESRLYRELENRPDLARGVGKIDWDFGKFYDLPFSFDGSDGAKCPDLWKGITDAVSEFQNQTYFEVFCSNRLSGESIEEISVNNQKLALEKIHGIAKKLGLQHIENFESSLRSFESNIGKREDTDRNQQFIDNSKKVVKQLIEEYEKNCSPSPPQDPDTVNKAIELMQVNFD